MPPTPQPPSKGDYVVCAVLVALLALIIVGLWTMAFSDPPEFNFDTTAPVPTKSDLPAQPSK